MSLLEANEFRVVKSVESSKTPIRRLEFLDPVEDTLLGYSLVTRGEHLITLKDPSDIELLHFEKNGLHNSSGNRLAELKREKAGIFKRPKFACEKDRAVLLTLEHSQKKITLVRENGVRATIEIKEKLLHAKSFVVNFAQDAIKEDRLIILGLILMLGFFFT
jgi:hypothetical protein